MIGNPLLLGGGDYEISRSVRLRSSASAFFNRTPASAGNRQIWTLSGWVKQGSALNSIFSTNSSDNSTYNYFGFDTNAFRLYQWNGSAYDFHLITTAVYRDPSAWYHFVIRVDTTQATAANRVRLYINSVEVTAFSTNTTPSQNLNTYVNSTSYSHLLGRNPAGSSTYFDGYLTEINFIDGQALTPSSFGESNSTTGVWQPKKYTGTYGTNGFYLNFSDNSNNTAATIGKDYSGNGNNWTPNNISVTSGATYDSMLDVPTPWADGGNGRGNYAVLNPLLSAGGATANGNLQVTTTTGVGHSRATIALPTSGKWYAEFTAVSAATATDYIFGIVGADTAEASYGYNQTPSYAYTAFGERVVNGTFTSSFYSSFTTGDIIGCAVNLDANEITWYKNGVAQTAISISNGSYFWMVTDASGTRQITAAFNAGQRPFAYTPPSGFKALNTQNLPEPTIKKGNLYFDATLYSGNNANPRSITGLSFQPDLVWVKQRTANGGGFTAHQLYDAVRGTQNLLRSNTTDAELSNPANGGVQSFNADGFTIQGSSASINMNNTGETYVGWQWKEGATQGFDIVTYTGNGANRTIAHSLGVAPSMMIFKRRDAVAGWPVYHVSVGNTAILSLQATAATSASATYFNNTSPTSSVFTVSTDSALNANTGTYVAYLFSEVAGFSRFGSYTGNGSSDGPFVYCGFRPRWVMIKRTDSTGPWVIWDSAREPTNDGTTSILYPYLSDAEYAQAGGFDLLSNGFKLRASTNIVDYNASGGTYIFMAMAEHPFKLSLAR